MCRWYGYDLDKRRPTCDKGHTASLKCHSRRKDCPDYTNDYSKGYVKGEPP